MLDRPYHAVPGTYVFTHLSEAPTTTWDSGKTMGQPVRQLCDDRMQ